MSQFDDILAKHGIQSQEQTEDDPFDAILKKHGIKGGKPEDPQDKGFFSNAADLAVGGAKSALTAARLSGDVATGSFDKNAPPLISRALQDQNKPKPKEMAAVEHAFAGPAKEYEQAGAWSDNPVDKLAAIGKTIWTVGEQAITNPKGTAYLTASQIANMAPSIVGMMGGAKTGALAGSLLGPAGTAAGAITGGLAGGFAGEWPMEAGSEFIGTIGKELQRRGLENNEQNVAALLVDKKFMDGALSDVRTKATTTSAVDAAFTLGAGRLATGPARAAEKAARAELGVGANAAQIASRAKEITKARTIPQKIGTGAKAVGLDVAGGGASEAAGQYAGYGAVDLADVGMEMLGELGGAGIEVPAAAWSYGKSAIKGTDQDADLPADDILTQPAPPAFDAPVAPKPTAAEQALADIKPITALDRVAALDTEGEALLQRKNELAQPDYGPMFDAERAEVESKLAGLMEEREAITKTWPKLQRGANTQFSTEAGVKLDGYWALIEADDLQPSHDTNLRPNPIYPPDMQPRSRSDRAGYEMQVSTIAQKLDPDLLGESPLVAHGAPIAGEDGLVESGTGRTLAIKRVYEANGFKAGKYRESITAKADRYGFTPDQVAGMKKPILIRVRTTPVDRAEFARQANASTVAQMSPSEQARADSARIDSLDDLNPDEAGDFTSGSSRGFVRRFMASLPGTEQAGMIDATGQLSQSGYIRMRNAILAKAYGDSPVLLRMVESLDNNLRGISNALMRAAPAVAKSRQAIAEGAMFDADITPDLMSAVEGLSRLKDEGRSVADALAQSGMFGEQYSPETRELLQYLAENIRKPRKIADFIQAYFEALAAAGHPAQTSLLGDTRAPGKGELLTAARGESDVQDDPDGGTKLSRRQKPGAQDRRQPGDEARNQGGAQGDEGEKGAVTDQRQDGETDKQFAKRVVDKRMAPASLPERHGDYFLMEGATVVPVANLISTKSDAENQQGGDNGPKRMAAAARGELGKRAPITVMPSARNDGKYEVVDGNGTLTSVKKYGWKNLPVQVVSRDQGIAMIEADKLKDRLKGNFKPPSLESVIGKALANKVLEKVEYWKPRLPKAKISDADRAKAEKMLGPVIDAAKKDEAWFDERVKKTAAAFGGRFLLGPTKNIERAAVKLVEESFDLGEMKDIVRATIVVDSYRQAQAAIETIAGEFKIRQINNKSSEDIQPVAGARIKNKGPTQEGYQDVTAFVYLPGGGTAEIQINTPEVLSAKESGHVLYEGSRVVKDDPARQAEYIALRDAQVELYSAADLANRRKSASEYDPTREPTGSASRGLSSPDSSSSLNTLPSGNLTQEPELRSSRNSVRGGNFSGTFIGSPSDETVPQGRSKPYTGSNEGGQDVNAKSRKSSNQGQVPDAVPPAGGEQGTGRVRDDQGGGNRLGNIVDDAGTAPQGEVGQTRAGGVRGTDTSERRVEPGDRAGRDAGVPDGRLTPEEKLQEGLNELGAVLRQYYAKVGGVRMLTPEESAKLMPALIKILEALYEKGTKAAKALIAQAQAKLKKHDDEFVRTHWNKITPADYAAAAQQAIENIENRDQQGDLFTAAAKPPKQGGFDFNQPQKKPKPLWLSNIEDGADFSLVDYPLDAELLNLARISIANARMNIVMNVVGMASDKLAQSGRLAELDLLSTKNIETQKEAPPAKPPRKAPPAGRDIPPKTGRNFVFGDNDLTYEGSWVQKATQNVEAVEMLKKLEADGRQATREEQAVLAKFIGWGASEIANTLFGDKLDGAAQALLDYDEAIANLGDKPYLTNARYGEYRPAFSVLHYRNPDLNWYTVGNITREMLDKARPAPATRKWLELRDRLQAVMTDQEWAEASRSTQYAHYTSKPVVKAMWRGMERMGFKGGYVLEPGAGIGVFPGLMPQAMAHNSSYTGIEFDSITGGILKQLFPDERVLVESFVDTQLPPNFFTVAAGNPPFGNTPILADPKYRKLGFALHDYFFAKTIDSVQPGGLVMFVSSRYTMDKLNDKARAWMSERADLVGAIRLPQTAFQKNAGTEVVTDVLFLRKKVPGETFEQGQAWAKSVPITVNGTQYNINEYFAAHPEMVLGKHSDAGSMYGDKEYTVEPLDGDIEAQFDKAVDNLPQDILRVERGSADEAAKVREIDFNPKAQKEGNYYVTDAGVLMQRENGVGVRVEKKSEKDIALIKDFVGLRDALKQAHYDQLNEGDWEKSLAALQKAYRAFVAKHGRVNQFKINVRKVEAVDEETGETYQDETRTKRLPLLEKLYDDPEYSRVMSLEDVNDDTGEITESQFLTDRVLGKPVQPEIRTPQDALLSVLNDVGKVDLAMIAGRLGMEEADVVNALGTAIYQDPSEGWVMADEYLSGNVKEKLEQAINAARSDRRYERNVEALREAQPTPKTSADIVPQLGMFWIPPTIYEQFLKEKTGVKAKVTYNKAARMWTVEAIEGRFGTQSTVDWGTPHRPAHEILDHAMNGNPVQITTKDPVNGGTVVLKDAMEAANQKIEQMKQSFSDWLWTDATRANELVKLYNDKFNTIAPRRFDGKHLDLPGASDAWRKKVHPHVKRGVWRIIQSGNTYLAHAVGSGKTAQMVMSAMEQKRLGLIKKPMIVVPNHMLQQMNKEWLEIYPAAKLMVADEKNFHTENRRRWASRVALSDVDGVIITHSAFKLLDIDPEFQKVLINRELEYLRAAYVDAGGDLDKLKVTVELDKKGKDKIKVKGSGQKSPTIKQLERLIEAMEQRLRAAMSSEGKDTNVRFDELGVDMLYVDEAHEYRKLQFATKRSVYGIDPVGSQQAYDLWIKTRWLKEKNPKRYLVMASGTPVTNTMAELYSIQKMMDYDTLESMGLEDFDSWAAQFGTESTSLEQTASGGYAPVTRFNKFVNVGELTQMFRQFADVLTSDHLAAMLGDKRPKAVGGGRQMTLSPKLDLYTAFLKQELEPRMVATKKWKKTPEQEYNPDPVINIMTDAKLAAIDMRFMEKSLPNDPDSKLNRMIDGVIRVYKETGDTEYNSNDGKPEAIKGATQMVFFEQGFGKGITQTRGFDARAWFEKRMRDAGIPINHVAFMADHKKSDDKLKLFKDVNAGRVRILVGSSTAMGTGVNAQQRLIAMHHLDAPLIPARLEQREGRILRQGNKNKNVQIYAHAMKGSYDEQGWAILARKQFFIDQALSGDANLREIEDVSEVSNLQQASAMLADDPRLMEAAGLKADIEKLERLYRAHEESRARMYQAYNLAGELIRTSEPRLAEVEKQAARVQDLTGDKFKAKADGQTFDKRKEWGEAIIRQARALVAKFQEGKVEVGSVSGFPVVFRGEVRRGPTDGAVEYRMSLTLQDVPEGAVPLAYDVGESVDPVGLSMRATNALADVARAPEKMRNAINEARSRQDALAGRLDAPFQFAQTLADKRTELMNLEEAIKTTAGAQQTWTLTNTATGETVKGVAAENERAAKLKMIPWRKFSDAALDQWQAVPDATLQSDESGIKVWRLENRKTGEVLEHVHAISLVDAIQQAVAAAGGGVADDWNAELAPPEATPMLSRGAAGPGIPIETLTAIRDRVAARMKNLPTVHVFASPDSPGVPGNLRAFIYQQGAQNDVEGALHQGEIYLFASGLRDALRAEQVLAEHEVTHYGLLGLLGKEGKRRVLQNIWARNARIRKQAMEKSKTNKINYIDATEEILADMDAKELTSLSGWRGLVLALRDWFASHGFDNIARWMNAALEGTLSDQARADLFAADLVRRARAFVENGPPMSGGLSSATALSQLRKLADDLPAQEKWLNAEARMRGFKDIEDLAARDYKVFENLAKLWREKHPADVMMSRAAEIIEVDGKARPTKNSNGKPIAQTDEALTNFWRWFGDSAVADEQGRPLMVYHGTENNFSAFDKRLAGANTSHPTSRLGHYLSSSPEVAGFFVNAKANTQAETDAFTASRNAARKVAKSYGFDDVTYMPVGSEQRKEADRAGKAVYEEMAYRNRAQIMPLYLSIKNPLTLTWDEWFKAADWVSGTHEEGLKEILEKAKSGGHDGLILPRQDGKNREYAGDTYIAFEPTQIKSATGNRGIFDPANPDIRLSRSGQANTAAQRADAILTDSTAKWRPLDAITKAGVKLVHLDRATKALYAKAGKLLDALTPEKVKAGMVADYGVPGAVMDQRAMMQGRKRVQLRKTEQLIDKLASLTRAESRVAYEWMNNDNTQAADYLEAQLPPESVAVLKDVREMIDRLSQEAVRLGQLDAETYKKHRYAYLRRSYAKHMEEMPGREKAKRQRAIAILGDQYKGRGMVLDVAMKSIQNVAPEWWQRKLQAGKADKGLKGEQFIRLERRAHTGEGTTPMAGIGDRSPGRLLEVAYWPAGEAIPTKLKDWERNGTWQVRDTKGDKLVLWRDFTKQERETMGEVDEARFAIARTLHGMIQDIETGRYLNWLADNHAVIDPSRVTGPVVEASERMRDAFAPEEWVKVPDTKIPGTNVMKYGKLAGRYLPGPIWNDVRQTVGFRFQPLGETYAALHSAWKTSKTALSPAVHMNNVMANFVMADWHDVGAGHILKSLRILLAASERDGKGIIGRTGNVASRAGIADREAAREILNRYQDSGGGIGTWITQEIQKEQMLPLIEALENELGLTGQNTANQIGVMAAVQKLMRLKFGEAWDAFKGSTPGGKVVQEARNLIGMYEAEDQVFRLAAWLKAKEDGINDLEAGKVARKSFLDYHINAPWVQMMRNTAFPFIAFTYRSVPMLLDVAANKPWKLMKLGMVLGALNAIGYALSGGDEDDERKLLPEEKSGSIWGIVPKLIRMPWNDAHGSPVFLDIRRFVPVGDIFDVGQPNTAVPVPPAVVPSGPLALLGELALNKSAFTGKPVTQETDTGTEKAGKVFDHLYKALAPNIAFLPGTHAWTSVTSAGGGKTDPFGREQSMAQAMASSVGFKLGSYPKDVLQYNAKRAAQAKVMEIDANINKLRREFARQGISEAEYQEKAQAQMEKKRRVMEELAEKAR